MRTSEALGRIGSVMFLIGLLVASIVLIAVGFTVNIWAGIALLWLLITVWILIAAMMLES